MIIFRYLTKEVFSALLATILILLILLISNQFVHYLHEAARGHLPPSTVMQMMSLQVPLLMGLLLPLALYIGILLVYSRLHADNEFTVLAACGYSQVKLLRQTAGFSSIVLLIVALLMFFVVPKMNWYKDYLLAQAMTASPLEKIFPRHFQTINKLTVYTGALSPNRQEIRDVFLVNIGYSADEIPKWTVIKAEKGVQLSNTSGKQIIRLSQGHRYQGKPGSQDFQSLTFKHYDVILPTKTIKFTENDVDRYAMLTLLHQLNNPKVMAELQWRIAFPLSIPILFMIAIPLSYSRSRYGRFAQLLPAIILYAIYVNLLFIARNWLENDRISPWLGLWWVHALMLFVGIGLWMRMVGFRRIFIRRQTC